MRGAVTNYSCRGGAGGAPHCLGAVRAYQKPPPRRRRRPVLSLTPNKPVLRTVRDRQRLLLEHNLRVAKPMRETVDDLVERAHHRLEWARAKLFQYWNPDWTKEVGGIATTAATATVARKPRRPVSVIMDARWWFWNLAFAALPSALLFVYCEFRGQYLMYEFHRERELEQMKKLLGEDYVEQHQHELVEPPPTNIVERVWNAAAELYWLLGGVTEPGPVVTQTTIHDDNSQAPSSQPAPTLDSTTSAPSDLQELAQRLQRLEAAVLAQPHQVERLRQSGIQNRSEDALIESWRTRTTAALDRPHPPTPPLSKVSQEHGQVAPTPGSNLAESVRNWASLALGKAHTLWGDEDAATDDVTSQNPSTGRSEPSPSPHSPTEAQGVPTRTLQSSSASPVAEIPASSEPRPLIGPSDDQGYLAPSRDSPSKISWWPW